MSKTLSIILVVAIIAASGCSRKPGRGPLEDVQLIEVVKEDETGEPDSYTIVEFPDGTRRMRWRSWGEKGDTFKACKELNGHWGS